MVEGMKKTKTKKKATQRKADLKPNEKGPKAPKTFVRASDHSTRKVGFPNMHITVAMEALKHAERAKTGRDAMRALFGDLYRVIGDAVEADGGFKLQDSMGAALNYISQIMVLGARADSEERRATESLDHIGQFVDMKQVPSGFFVRARREVTRLLAKKRVRRRRGR